MPDQTSIAISLFFAVAFIISAATCQAVKTQGEAQVREARAEAGEWEGRARAYAETLRELEDARRRAEQSTREFTKNVREAETAGHEARQIVEEMRRDAVDCGWLDERVPDRVRNIVTRLYAGSDCAGDKAAGNADNAMHEAGSQGNQDERGSGGTTDRHSGGTEYLRGEG